MEKIRLKCPFCGAVLETLDDPKNYSKSIICPNCKTKNKFTAFKRIVLLTRTAEDDVTKIEMSSQEDIGQLVDIATGQTYQLREGINLVGRMTLNSTSLASIPIKTDDMGMSRKHLFINVIKGKDGHYHAYAYKAGSKNSTFINEKILEDNDEIGLKHNDILLLCKTRLKYIGVVIDDKTELLPFTK